MKVILTGATGFIGSAFLQALLGAGHDVTLVLRDVSDPWRIEAALPDVGVVYTDLLDQQVLLNAFEKQKADAVAHFAWHGVAGGHKNDDEQLTINLPVAENMLALGKQVQARTFMALGSQAEYGKVEGKIAETTDTCPETKYGEAKCKAREVAESFCARHDMRMQWFRLFSLYGPDEREPWLIPFLVRNLVQEGSCALTSCEQIRDYLYIDDAASAFREALEKGVEGVFHVASGRGVVLRNLVEQVQQMANPSADLGFGELEQRVDQPHELVADISSIQSVTCWKPEVNLDTGLKETVSSLLDEYQRIV